MPSFVFYFLDNYCSLDCFRKNKKQRYICFLLFCYCVSLFVCFLKKKQEKKSSNKKVAVKRQKMKIEKPNPNTSQSSLLFLFCLYFKSIATGEKVTQLLLQTNYTYPYVLSVYWLIGLLVFFCFNFDHFDYIYIKGHLDT